MSRKAVHATRKLRSRAEGSRLLEEDLGSGLNLKDICQQYRPDRSTLAGRLRQLETRPPRTRNLEAGSASSRRATSTPPPCGNGSACWSRCQDVGLVRRHPHLPDPGAH
jgi:hypothetical protein